MTDFVDDSHDWDEFTPQPSVGDVAVLNEHIKRAIEIQKGLKILNERCSKGKELLKTLLEKQIPELSEKCGLGPEDSISINGFNVQVKYDSYANIPSISSIDDEKDDDRRAELMDRRIKGLAILEEKAPSLCKHKFEVQFDREDSEKAKEFEKMLDELPDPPQYVNSVSVHPATLSKWINELKENDGYNFTPEEVYAFGIYPRRIAKITKR